MWRSHIPLLLRVLTAAVSAAAVRVGLAATSHSLRQVLGGVYTTFFVRVAAFGCCFLSIIIWNTVSFPPAAFAAVSSLVFAASSAAGLHTVAAVALCLTGGSIATAASKESLVFITAAVAGSVSASVAPIAEKATGPPQEMLSAISAAVLFALSCLYLVFRVPYGENDAPANTISRRRPHRRRSGNAAPKRFTGVPNVLLRFASLIARCRERGDDAQTLLTAVGVFSLAAAMVIGVVAPLGWQLRSRVLRPPLPRGYELLEQRRGVTGLISVVEDHNRNIRFLTCDHSVLGGIYISEQYYGENIFGQFHVHEAVRLSRGPGEEPGERRGGSEGRALCIGVGIGVVANTLHTLGSHVDAVEIDPVVGEFAREYFHFRPENLIIEDADKFLQNQRVLVENGLSPPYDFVVHDVFTGGAVPVRLFSVDVFQRIQDVMTPDGILAVNFVGATTDDAFIAGGNKRKAKRALAAVSAVAARLRAVFPFVRAFSDEHVANVHNIVFFASAEENRVHFREATNRDIMDSAIREDSLSKFEEHELPSSILEAMDYKQATDRVINGGQWITAGEHWRVIREEFTNDLWHAIAS